MTRKTAFICTSAAFVVCGVGMFLGCGATQPFPTNDPPPTFAFKYVLQSPPGVLVPSFTGSTLKGNYTVSIAGTPYVNSGNVYSFGPTFVSFGQYETVQGAYWPANWLISSVGGCGAGTSGLYGVTLKVFEVDCVPKLLDPTISPTTYNSQSVHYLTVSFSTPIPAGTVATVRFVDGGSGSIETQNQMTFTGSSSVTVEGPNDVPDGGHYVTFDFADNGYNPGGYDAMYAPVSTTGYNCVPSKNHACL